MSIQESKHSFTPEGEKVEQKNLRPGTTFTFQRGSFSFGLYVFETEGKAEVISPDEIIISCSDPQYGWPFRKSYKKEEINDRDLRTELREKDSPSEKTIIVYRWKK